MLIIITPIKSISKASLYQKFIKCNKNYTPVLIFVFFQAFSTGLNTNFNFKIFFSHVSFACFFILDFRQSCGISGDENKNLLKLLGYEFYFGFDSIGCCCIFDAVDH